MEWAKLQIAKAVASDGTAVNTVIISEASVRVEKREHFARHLENIGLMLLPLPVAPPCLPRVLMPGILTGSKPKENPRSRRFPWTIS
jgi:hypothetical protein